ncbi:GntR family transcriptional regulator [Phytoactinopolyspora limicola]|uniref:GntR family transcriptional regulator n=1 Tax=Phytoactinopolyspora limicola TaxID=2715536 RepID=UPI00140B3AD6|nr:winged helix-turn-helix domain-containing protein [Phytoactinopolyspora limicola]
MGLPKFEPDPAQPSYLYMQFADFIATCIEEGRLPPGARLPGERDLAVEYGLSIGTIRRATTELRIRGLVLTLPAKGTFVMPEDRRPPPPDDALRSSR